MGRYGEIELDEAEPLGEVHLTLTLTLALTLALNP